MLRGKYNEQTELLISEFLENIIHQILYQRKVYPQELFEKVNLSEFCFYYCEHSLLKNYIAEMINSIKEKIFKQEISKLSIGIKKEDQVLETFTLQFTFKFSSNPNLEEIYMNFKPFFEKLQQVEKLIGIPNENTTFIIRIHLKKFENFSDWKRIDLQKEKSQSKNMIHQLVHDNLGLEIEFHVEKFHLKSYLTIVKPK